MSRWIVSLFIVILCSGVNTQQYLKNNVYEETDCTGYPSWTIFTLIACTPSGEPGKWQTTNCSASGVETLTCNDIDCVDCTSAPLSACYSGVGRSNNYECVDELPPPPPGSFVEEKYENDDCTGTTLFFQAYVKNYCIAGSDVSTSYNCTESGLFVNTCQDSGTCSTNCTSGPLNLGCVNQNTTNAAEKSVKISCTPGDALYTTGSSTSTGNNSSMSTTTGIGATTGEDTTTAGGTTTDASTTGTDSTTGEDATTSASASTTTDAGTTGTDATTGASTTGGTSTSSDATSSTPASTSASTSTSSTSTSSTTTSTTADPTPSTSASSTSTSTSASTSTSTSASTSSTSSTTTKSSSSSTATSTTGVSPTTSTTAQQNASTSGVATSGNGATTTTASATTTTTGVPTGQTIEVTIQNITSNSVKVSWRVVPLTRRNTYFFVVELSNPYRLVYNGTDTVVEVNNLRTGTAYTITVSFYDVGASAYTIQTATSFNTSSIAPPPNEQQQDYAQDSTSPGVVAGAVVGAFVFVVLVVALIFVFLRRKQRVRPQSRTSRVTFESEITGGSRRATIGLAVLGTGYSMRDLSKNADIKSTNSDTYELSSSSGAITNNNRELNNSSSTISSTRELNNSSDTISTISEF